jgi:hypothetical protein
MYNDVVYFFAAAAGCGCEVDLGGGTFDVSVVDVSAARVETVAIGGDPRLGGGDFDDR